MCIFAAKLLDGYRAYAGVLSGYTVGIIAVQQIDNPHNVFEVGMERGAAIVVGILSVAVMNELMFAPDRRSQLNARLVAIRRRVQQHAHATLHGEPDNPADFLALLRELVGLRPELATMAPGFASSAAARSTAVALVAELQAIRTLRVASVQALRQKHFSGTPKHVDNIARKAPSWAVKDLKQRSEQVHENLVALRSGRFPPQSWRAPLYRSYRTAAESGIRAALWLAIASTLLVWAGWPAASASLFIITVIIGLGAITPDPRGFAIVALIATPVAAALAGILEFVMLDGATEFPLLALALAPIVIGIALFIESRNPLVSGLGRINLIFVLAIFAPTNPETYNPLAFLITSLFLFVAAALVVGGQMLIPPISDAYRRTKLVAAARRDQWPAPSTDRLAPEEAAFREATRFEQFLSAGGAKDGNALAVMFSSFDGAAVARSCDAKLMQFVDGPLAPLAEQVRAAIAGRDASFLRVAARAFGDKAAYPSQFDDLQL
jgi:uncharacterized membrane protein YccC